MAKKKVTPRVDWDRVWRNYEAWRIPHMLSCESILCAMKEHGKKKIQQLVEREVARK